MACFSCEGYIYVENICYLDIRGSRLPLFAPSPVLLAALATYLPLICHFFSSRFSVKPLVRRGLQGFACHFATFYATFFSVLFRGVWGLGLPFWAYIPIYLLFNYKVIKKWQSGKNPPLTRGFTTFAVAKSGKKVANNRQIRQKVAKKTQRVKPKPRVEFRS